MADVTQQDDTLLVHQLLTNAATAAGLSVVGSEVAVSSFVKSSVTVHHAVIEAAANDPGVDYVFQGRKSTSADLDEDWSDLWTFSSGTIASVAAEISGAEAADETTIAVDADPTGPFTLGRIIYIEDTVTVIDGEWARVAISAAGPDIVTIVDGLTNAKDAADTMWSQAEVFNGSFDVTGYHFVRMIVVGRDATGADIHFKAEMTSFTDFV